MQIVFCTECGSDYVLGVNEEEVVISCDCGHQDPGDIIEGVEENLGELEVVDTDEDTPEDKMFN